MFSRGLTLPLQYMPGRVKEVDWYKIEKPHRNEAILGTLDSRRDPFSLRKRNALVSAIITDYVTAFLKGNALIVNMDREAFFPNDSTNEAPWQKNWRAGERTHTQQNLANGSKAFLSPDSASVTDGPGVATFVPDIYSPFW